jgi:hypothetical protein
VKDLDLVALAVAEDEESRSEGTQAELLIDDGQKPVDRLSHVDDPPIQIDLDFLCIGGFSCAFSTAAKY